MLILQLTPVFFLMALVCLDISTLEFDSVVGSVEKFGFAGSNLHLLTSASNRLVVFPPLIAG
jgi:hypothetical protein